MAFLEQLKNFSAFEYAIVLTIAYVLWFAFRIIKVANITKLSFGQRIKFYSILFVGLTLLVRLFLTTFFDVYRDFQDFVQLPSCDTGLDLIFSLYFFSVISFLVGIVAVYSVTGNTSKYKKLLLAFAVYFVVPGFFVGLDMNIFFHLFLAEPKDRPASVTNYILLIIVFLLFLYGIVKYIKIVIMEDGFYLRSVEFKDNTPNNKEL